MKQSIDYASTHPGRGGAAIGPAVSLRALATASDLPLDDLSVGDELLAVYDPLDDNAELKAPQSVAAELSAALETLGSARGMRIPLSLFEIGYPSAPSVGSSEQAQLAFFDTLFGVLASSRDRIGFVGIFGLADRASADCVAEASLFGGSAAEQATRTVSRCTMGLRADQTVGTTPPETSADKLAWPTVLAALSRFR